MDRDPERVVAVSVSATPRATLVVDLTAQEERAVLDDASRVELPPYGYTIIEETG